MEEQYRYSSLNIDEDDDKAHQPSAINIELKPHQLTAIAKMISMEVGKVAYDLPNGSYDIDAVSIGILADKAGYGKTLTMLGLIASNDIININKSIIQCSFAQQIGQALCIRKENNYIDTYKELFLDSTLIIVKHGTVFNQWSKAISQNTSLTYKEIGSHRHATLRNRETLIATVRGKDIVLVSDTMYKQFMQTSNLVHWKRVVVDEADDIFCPAMPDVRAKFSWLVTATPMRLQYPKNHGLIRRLCPQILFGDHLRAIDFITVRNEDSYILQSFDVPPCETTNYLCRDIYHALCEFATPQLVELLNANDLQGALQCLDGSDGDDINKLIVKKTGTEINNLKIMIEAIDRQTMPERDKQAKLTQLQQQLSSKQESVDNMHRRLKELSEQECAICQDSLQNPVSLSCFHVFCGECVMTYLKACLSSARSTSKNAVCPMCRAPIRQQEIFKLTESSSTASTSSCHSLHQTKNEMIMSLIKANPQGKFLIFCNYDTAFHRLAQEFIKEKISHSELKGHSEVKTLTRFQQGDIRVVMLNSRNNGSGIDISCASDIIFYMRIADPSEDSQALARAQRVGRQTPLRVHRMYHRNELMPDVTNYVLAKTS